jgi:hypothetical protein
MLIAQVSAVNALAQCMSSQVPAVEALNLFLILLLKTKVDPADDRERVGLFYRV